MNEALRNKAIDITRRHLVRQGSRRVSMDMIAREMHISKRTLYILFTDKSNLVEACISEIRKDYEEKVREYLTRSEDSAWNNFNWLVNEYLQNLYNVDYSFLLDMQHTCKSNDFSAGYQSFWQETFEDVLNECRRQEYVTDDFSVSTFVKNLMVMSNKSRIEGVSQSEQEGFCRLLVRGISRINLT